MVLNMRTALIINIVLLTVGPIAVVALGYFATKANKLYWPWHGWIRFPIALIFNVALAIALIFCYAKFNPYVSVLFTSLDSFLLSFRQATYRSPLVVLLSFACLMTLSMYGILKAFALLLPIPSQRQIVLVEYYVLWWILLVYDTVLLDRSKLGSLYPVVFFYGGAFLALLVALLEVLLFKPLTPNTELPSDPDDPSVETALVVERAEPPGPDESDERTPLLVTRRKVVGLKSEIYNEKQAGGMWIWQYLVILPFPVLLIAQLAWALLYALSGTLADGGSTKLCT